MSVISGPIVDRRPWITKIIRPPAPPARVRKKSQQRSIVNPRVDVDLQQPLVGADKIPRHLAQDRAAAIADSAAEVFVTPSAAPRRIMR